MNAKIYNRIRDDIAWQLKHRKDAYLNDILISKRKDKAAVPIRAAQSLIIVRV